MRFNDTPKLELGAIGRTRPTLCDERARLIGIAIAIRVALTPLGRFIMSISTILLILLVLLLIGALPAWPYSSGWGYYPSGGLGLVLIVLLVLVVTGRL
jgi:Protein of unknown function (DUF3309)